jgi:protein involved in ribonucleotide reduction
LKKFRKPLLYPFELRGQNNLVENTPAIANGKRNAISLFPRARFN